MSYDAWEFIFNAIVGTGRLLAWFVITCLPIVWKRTIGRRGTDTLKAELAASLDTLNREFINDARWFWALPLSFGIGSRLNGLLVLLVPKSGASHDSPSTVFLGVLVLASFIPLAIGSLVAPRHRRATVAALVAIYLLIISWLGIDAIVPGFARFASDRLPAVISLLFGAILAFVIAHRLDRRGTKKVG